MDDNRLTLYIKFPLWHIFLALFLLLFTIYGIIFTDNTILQYLNGIFVLIIGISMTVTIIVTNIFKKFYFLINKEGILVSYLFGKKMFLWEELISYSISGYEKSGDLFLNFQTEKTKNNKNIFKSKNAIKISSKLCKIKMEELINKINEIRCSNIV